MKKLLALLILVAATSSYAADYECKLIEVNNSNEEQVCFPMGHVCKDPHGIGDGVPIEIDCWTGVTRACNQGSDNWPACMGGIYANTCKDVELDGATTSVCFPTGKTCMDPHGIGDGVPTEIDCWTGVTRACNQGSKNWPSCMGGFIKQL